MANTKPKGPGKGNRTNHPPHGARWNKGGRTANQTFRVNPDVLAALKDYCAANDLSANDWFEQVITDTVGPEAIERRKRARAKMPEGETDEPDQN